MRKRTRFLTIAGTVAITACGSVSDPDAVRSIRPGQGVARQATGAPVLRNFPGDDDGPPFYSEMSPNYLPHNDQMAALPFVRRTDCVPSDFNLLRVLDFTPAPDGSLRVFQCPLTIHGQDVWHDLADPFPYREHYEGNGAVPIWFVTWPELESALSDGSLTIAELRTLPSLVVGHADFYEESISNSTQGERSPHSSTEARGRLTDGRAFLFHLSETLKDGTRDYRNAIIEFK